MASSAGVKAGRAFIVVDAVDKTGMVLKNVAQKFRAMGAQIQAIGMGMFKGGLAGLAAGAIPTKIFANFDDAMRKVEARSSGTEAEMEALRNQAKELGRTTSNTAAEVGELQAKLAQKGFNRAAIKNMTADVRNLASAAGEGTDQDAVLAADLVSGTLRAFSMESTEAGRLADVFTAAVNNSNFSLDALITSMQTAAPVAAKYGLSVEDTVAALAGMTDLNIDASTAGTSFRNMLLRMSDPKLRDDFNSMLKDMTGKTIDFVDQAGNLRSMPEILFAIGDAVKDLGTADQGKLLGDLLGTRAIVGGGALSQGKNPFDTLREKLLNSEGLAKRTSDAMNKGLGGSLRMLMSSAEGVAIAIGEALAPSLQELSTWLQDNLGKFTGWIEKNQGMIVLAAKVIAGVTALGAAFVILGVGLKIAAVAFSVLSVAAGVVSTILGAILSPVGLVVAAIAGLVALAAMVSTTFRSKLVGALGFVMERFSAMGETIKQTFGGIMQALQAGDFKAAFAIFTAGLQVLWAQLIDFFMDAVNGFVSWIGTKWLEIVGPMKPVIESLKQSWGLMVEFFTSAWESAVEIFRPVVMGIKDVFTAVVQTLKSLWDSFIGFFVSSSDAAAMNITQRMLSAQKSIATFLLDTAAEDGILGDIIDKVLGVDVSGERKKSIELERQRLESAARLGIDTEPQQNAFDEARQAMIDDFDKRIEAAGSDKAVDDFTKGLEEADKARQADIEKRKQKLNELLSGFDTRKEAEDEAAAAIKATSDEQKNQVENLLKDAQGAKGGGLPPELLRGLEAGSVEAAEQFYKNMQNAQRQDDKQVKKLEEANKHLENIDRNLAEQQALANVNAV